MKPQIFISYAREDYEPVEHLYLRLLYAGFEPWVDKKNILPGENWKLSIEKAIRNSDLVLICLSNNSANKRGFLQREIKEALELWKERLEDDIYLIPVRLEDCTVPESLSEFQWVNLYESTGWILLHKAIREGLERLGKPYETLSTSGLLKLTNQKIFERKDIDPKYIIDIEFPKIEGLNERSDREINAILEGFFVNHVHRFRGDFSGTTVDEWLSRFTSELTAVYEVSLLSDELMSLKFDFSEYGAGAAHSNQWSVSFNYQLHPTIPIELYQLFRPEMATNHLNIISQYCFAELKKQAQAEDFLEGDEVDTWICEDGIAPKPENFAIFNITKTSLIFTFIPYQVGPYAWGTRLVEIPFAAIKDYLDRNGILNPLLL
jgi:hypothetical protein